MGDTGERGAWFFSLGTGLSLPCWFIMLVKPSMISDFMLTILLPKLVILEESSLTASPILVS